MVIIIFAILMFVVFGRILSIAIKAAWGILKILFSIVFLPFLLIGFMMAGLVAVAFILLIIIGIISFFVK